MTTETLVSEYQQQKTQPKTEIVTGRVTEQVKERAQAKCERLEVPLSFVIERAVQEWADTD